MMNLLQENETQTAQLVERFKVSRRTILRDIQLLRDARIPISLGENGGFRLPPTPPAHEPKPVVTPFIGKVHVLVAKMTLATTSFSNRQIQYVLARLGELQDVEQPDLDDAQIEAIFASWIEAAKNGDRPPDGST